MKSYKEWLEEALKLSQYRDQYKIFKKHFNKKYDAWFGDAKRIYLPLNGFESDSTYQLVNSKLNSKGYEISSWKDGIAVKKESNRIIRIGKLLADDDSTLKKFNERFKGKNASEEKEYEIVISRHLYDYVSQSTDRQWSSCKNLVDGENKYYIPAEFETDWMIAYVIEKGEEYFKDVHSKISKEVSDEIFNAIKKTQHRSSDVIGLRGKIFDKKEFYDNITDTRMNIIKYLSDGVEEGIEEFKEIIDKYEKHFTVKQVPSKEKLNDPIARLLIVPYFNPNNPEDIFLYVPDRPYGKMVSGFRETVQAWLDKKQGKKTGVYCRTNSGYDDKYPAKINKDTGEELMHDNPTFNLLTLGYITFFKNGEPTDYSPDNMKRLVANKDDAYPLSSFMEEVYIDEASLIEAAIAGVNTLKKYFIDTLEALIDNWENEKEGTERDRYLNYYKKLIRMINSGTMAVRFTLE